MNQEMQERVHKILSCTHWWVQSRIAELPVYCEDCNRIYNPKEHENV